MLGWASAKWARRRAGARFRAARGSGSIVAATYINFRKIEFSKFFDLKKISKFSEISLFEWKIGPKIGDLVDVSHDPKFSGSPKKCRGKIDVAPDLAKRFQ